jgi:DNA-binding NarL/FixJ family response regulator
MKSEQTERPRVLLVDDDSEMHEAFRLCLQDQFELTSVLSGEEAVQAAEREAFSVACVDLMMKGISGIETLKQLKATSKCLSVIMVTGHESLDTAIESMEQGAFRYIVKPFEFADLLKAVQLGRRRYEDELDACAAKVEGPEQLEMHGLRPREAEVAFNVIQGRTSSEISERLKISRRTTEKHLQKIFERLGISNAIKVGPKIRELRNKLIRKPPAEVPDGDTPSRKSGPKRPKGH